MPHHIVVFRRSSTHEVPLTVFRQVATVPVSPRRTSSSHQVNPMSPPWKIRFRGASWTILFVAAVTLATTALRGDPGSGDRADEPHEQLVMLSSGRILSGQIQRNAGGYLVERPGGSVQITVDDAFFIADDLRGLYRKQRDATVHPTPSTYLSLANWCISVRLHDEARDELKKCLKVDPDNNEARRLLQRMTDTIRSSLPSSAVRSAPRRTHDGFLQMDFESLGGLSRETATLFTSRIQPLLLNKCGNASCHGQASPNEFRLVSARIGGNGSRQNSERNLAATLKFVDTDDVASSPLLNMTDSHGGKGSIFVGTAGSEQIRLLRNWARSVAAEKQATKRELDPPSAFARGNSPKNTNRPVDRSVAKVKKSNGFASRETRSENLAESDHSANNDDDVPEPDVEPASKLEPYDTFDPEVFNRRLRRR